MLEFPGHFWHVLTLEREKSSENRFTSHGVHAPFPASSLYVPCKHPLHDMSPDPVYPARHMQEFTFILDVIEVEFSAHAVHDALAVPEYVSAAHDTQVDTAVLPDVLENVPVCMYDFVSACA